MSYNLIIFENVIRLDYFSKLSLLEFRKNKLKHFSNNVLFFLEMLMYDVYIHFFSGTNTKFCIGVRIIFISLSSSFSMIFFLNLINEFQF